MCFKHDLSLWTAANCLLHLSLQNNVYTEHIIITLIMITLLAVVVCGYYSKTNGNIKTGRNE